MNTNETANQILEETTPTDTQLTETLGKEQEAGLWAWVKANKKPLILAAIGVAATAGVVCGIRSRKSAVDLMALHEKTEKRLPKELGEAVPVVQLIEPVELEPVVPARSYTKPTVPFDVTGHIRNLPEGQHHSAEKAAQAVARNIPLKPNQTLVDTYSKYAA